MKHKNRANAALLTTEFDKGVKAHRHGKLKEAEVQYKSILDRWPNHAPSLHHLALIEKANGNRERFYALTKRAIQINPSYALAYSNLANTLREDGRLDEALAAINRALDIEPRLPEALNVKGLIQHQRERIEEAIKLYECALLHQPQNVEFISNYAAALHSAERRQEAEENYLKVLEVQPMHPRVCNNYGVLLKDRKETENSRLLYHRAIAKDPGYSDAHWNLSLIQLMNGEYELGWKEYEWRWSRSDSKEKRPNHPFREMKRGENWKGKRLFVYAEQGMGDTIQFYRYIKEISKYAAVYFAPHKRLIPILSQNIEENIKIVDLQAVPSDAELALPLMSIPYLMPEYTEPMVTSGPYLYAEEKRVNGARSIFESDRINIGLCWQGSRNKIDHGRSIELRKLVALTELESTRFYSLQRVDGIEQLAPPPDGIRMRVFDEKFDADGAFLDTASIIHHLDLVITTDTAMAHLAGAMGKETWVLLQYVPDWRWRLNDTTTPWYPNTRLYRQTSPGDWEKVVERVRQDLKTKVGENQKN